MAPFEAGSPGGTTTNPMQTDRLTSQNDAIKAPATMTTTEVPSDGGSPSQDGESGTCKPDRNLTAAIWTIVCGVALPCIPVIVISAVLLWMVLHNRVSVGTGYPELQLPAQNTRCHGFTQCLKSARHNAGPAYFVAANPSTITTIASWTSRVIPYLTSSIMALVAFFAARKLVTKSKNGTGDDLPSPEQLTLLIDLLGGKGFEPLKDTILHRWAHKKPLADPIPLAFSALLIITLLGLVIPAVDTWFGIATTATSVTELFPIPGAGTAGELVYSSSRALNSTLCPHGAGVITNSSGSLWVPCNIDWDVSSGPDNPNQYLQGADEAIRVLQASPLALSNVSAYPVNQTAGDGKFTFYYLANPYIGDPGNFVDFKASTIAIQTQCHPITQQCLPNQQWPLDTSGTFSCTPAFTANFTYSGLSQTDTSGDSNLDNGDPAVGVAFSINPQLTTRVGQILDADTIPGSNDNMTYSLIHNAYLYPQNPLYFAAWASGYPYTNAAQMDSTAALSNPLLNDSQIYRQATKVEWILNCSATVYDVSYTWINGSVSSFNTTLSSPELGGLISAPWALDGVHERAFALSAAAAAASATDSANDLANMFADHFSQASLALSAGAMAANPNLLTQLRMVYGPFARVPKIPFCLLLALKALYVLAVIFLAIGAYCFTHPAETEVVKSQLSTKGLAAAHFDTPDILQSNVVKQIGERLKPSAESREAAEAEKDEPPKDGIRRAKTLGEMEGKKVGVVARADGAWRFAVVANGVWNGIKPVAVDVMGLEAKAGNLGAAGGVVDAWMR